ncbi:MAG: hypothetical protein A2X93_04460 [Deltaproteobacteria bacterium GWC2_56_8]|nr:MAG: hypothetical protein A2X93_04460 [Deltaproteobacteria bacterium GWC2_56_8]
MGAKKYMILSTMRDDFSNDLGFGYIREFVRGGAEFLDYDDLYMALGKGGLEDYLLKRVDSIGAEVVVLQSSPSDFHFSLGFLERLRKKAFMVMTAGDCDHYFDIRDIYYAQCFDLVVVYDSLSRFRFRQYGIDAVSFFSSFDASKYYRVDTTGKDIDVSFIGDFNGKLERQEYIEYAAKNGIMVETFGTGSKNGPLPLVKMVEVFNRTKVNLNFTRISRRNALRREPSINSRLRQVKGRISEIALSGGFVLTEYVPGIEEAYEPGKEVEVFDSRDELVEKIRYYLAHNAERSAIAEAGHERAVRDYDVMTAIPRLVALIDERRHARRRRFSPVCVDSHFERYYATFRVRMLARFVALGRWRYALEEIETILKTGRIDARKAVGFFVFSVFPNLKSIYLSLRNANRY